MSMSIATQATLKVGKVAGLSRYASLGSRRVDARRFRCKPRLAFYSITNANANRMPICPISGSGCAPRASDTRVL